MKVKSAEDLYTYTRPDSREDHLAVYHDDNGEINGLRWRQGMDGDSDFYQRAKRSGRWNGKMWCFPDKRVARKILDFVISKRPELPILKEGIAEHPFAGVRVSLISFPTGEAACLLPLPLPPFAVLDAQSDTKIVLNGAKKGERALMVIDTIDHITDLVDSVCKQGASVSDMFAQNCGFLKPGTSPVNVETSGWAVRLICNLNDPSHYFLKPKEEVRWEGQYPDGVRVVIPWTGTIQLTRKRWKSENWRERIKRAGIILSGADPDAEIVAPVNSFDYARVPGWNAPAMNNHTLHDYQREGVNFCIQRGMRALIGDEMGIGKTAQAIAAAEAIDAKRVVVICPANARFVWQAEIEGWSTGGIVQHVENQLDKLDPDARWHIITYDEISVKTQTFRVRDESEEQAIQSIRIVSSEDDKENDKQKDLEILGKEYPKSCKIFKAPLLTPDFADIKRRATWERSVRRLHGELLEQLIGLGPMLLIVDEAHRAKNRDAKRTRAIQKITANNQVHVLLLTGTPLRNNEHEAAVLLSLLDGKAAEALSKRKGYTIQDVKDYLGYFMIRRTKAEVLPQLPPKTRQRIDLTQLDPEMLAEYQDCMNYAWRVYRQALGEGLSEGEAKKAAQGLFEKARTALGLAKVKGGEVADIVANVVENKGCCVVFCAHHYASDTLRDQLRGAGLTASVLDGRTPLAQRSQIVNEFQAGRLQVFIGGINAAGESITLTRADTVVFVELDYVPAALQQAEDRIHRVGQENNCLVLHLVARGIELDETMISVVGSKIERIGQVLDEGIDNIIQENASAATVIFDRLLGGYSAASAGFAGPSQATSQTTTHTPILTKSSIFKEAPPSRTVPGLNPSSRTVASNQVAGRRGRSNHHSDVQAASVPPETPAIGEATATKRGPGRPKMYIGDQTAPSATERSKRSIQRLNEEGGKRLMLRLTPQAMAALKSIMAGSGFRTETETINEALIALNRSKKGLKRMSTKKPEI